MNEIDIKGWCPGALQPMASGDGLVVRIRPFGGMIDAGQAIGIAALSERYGNGLIDLTSRANLQIRGVGEKSHLPLVEGLAAFGLLDPDPETEARRNILITPFWTAGDEAASIATELEQALARGPVGLPNKFGFAVDCGRVRVLSEASADVRIERDAAGELIVRADGADTGRRVGRDDVVGTAIALAEWFVASGGAVEGRGRMAAHLGAGATLPASLDGDGCPAPALAAPQPKLYPQGAMVAVALGQLTHTALRYLGVRSRGLRLTPWRMILVEGLHQMPDCEGVLTGADDPLLRTTACTGAPRCASAHAETRMLAGVLAPRVAADATLHISGCAKGCAHSGNATVTLVATEKGFDLIRNGSVRDTPDLRGLSSASILTNPSLLSGGA
jgi:precorrin-3B synthase